MKKKNKKQLKFGLIGYNISYSFSEKYFTEKFEIGHYDNCEYANYDISNIKSLQIFVEMYTMTKGGPLNSTITVVYLIFSNAFEKTDAMGYGAALAYVLFAIIGLLSFIQMKLLGNKE